MNPGLTIVCRPARFSDQGEVLELTRTVWGGQDYIPRVWAEWLADPLGLLLVAEAGGQAVGLGKLTDLGWGEWWLEGLRVAPAWQGQGVASHIHEYLMEAWERRGGGIVRLATSSERLQVHHLCARLGFFQVADLVKLSWFEASPGPFPSRPAGASERVPEGFAPLGAMDLPQAIVWASERTDFSGAAGLITRDWRWAQAVPDRLMEWVRAGRLWRWQDRGLLALHEEDEDGIPFFAVSLLVSEDSCRADLLGDACRLASSLGARGLTWRAPNRPRELGQAQEAGLQRSGDLSLFLFEART
ncbi:MAG: GNAT family N-acetyltransferase [Anaerolineales bacterium]